MTTKILIVDDHLVVREGLKQILELEPDFHVIGIVNDGFECLDFIEGQKPDLIFMDLKMPGLNGIETTRHIGQKYPEIRIVMLTVYDEEEYITQAIQSGAKGYVLKDAERSELVKIVRQIGRDQRFLDPALTAKVFDSIKGGAGSQGPAKPALTKRELQVLQGLVDGKSDREIGLQLSISEHTARTHIKNVYRKLGVSSRSQAAVKALKEGIVDGRE
jgi:two-component system response regulator DegU